jgi:hypothetical protein
MDASAYDKAAFPEPFIVLRTRLLPYSFGHHLLLNLIESPFVTGKDATYDDLAIAVVICSRPFAEARAFIHAHRRLLWWALRCFEWSVSGKLNPLVWVGARKPRVINLDAEAKEFRRYKDDGRHVPYHAIPETTSEFKCPLIHAVWASLIYKTSLSDAEIMDRQWSLCLQQYYLIQHFGGVIQICDKGAIQQAQEAGQRLAKHLSEKGMHVASV